MSSFDKRVDEYIDKSAYFAKPILKHFRALVHAACSGVEETMKWSFPHFDYKGNMCSMASFKQHCAITFWKASLMKDPNKIFDKVGETAMGQLGRITSLKDLPSDKILTAYIKEAMKLNEDGVKIVKAKKEAKKIEVPADLTKALNKNKLAKMHFDEFSQSQRNEYSSWIEEAKTEATRNKRIETAVEWISEGKIRNWKYVK